MAAYDFQSSNVPVTMTVVGPGVSLSSNRVSGKVGGSVGRRPAATSPSSRRLLHYSPSELVLVELSRHAV